MNDIRYTRPQLVRLHQEVEARSLHWVDIKPGNVYWGYFMDFDHDDLLDPIPVPCRIICKDNEDLSLMIPYDKELFHKVALAVGKTTDILQDDYWEHPELTEEEYEQFDEDYGLIYRDRVNPTKCETIHGFPCWILSKKIEEYEI